MISYAVGDVHGSLDKLIELMHLCDNDAAGRPMRYIFLGDYIDRGPDSRAVVQILIELQREHPGRDVFLKGNHEDMLACAADSHLFEERWLSNGGTATLKSYGVDSAAALPREDVVWSRQLPLFFDDGQHFFVHAGVHPDRPLDRQDEFDLLWIRKPFLTSHKDFGRLIVHGHTPLPNGLPDLRPNRINLDTGAFLGRPLTAAVFIPNEIGPVRFLQST